MSTTADLIFPELATNFSQTLNSLKRSTLSIHNRLTSIIDDSEFVDAVAEAYKLPLIANERCGSWYIKPERKAGSAYFKSTDGHMGQWAFSLRRLNLQVLEIIAKSDGCIIVDSTRRGKSMPDALSKTVPIWCAVMNMVLFPDHEMSQELFTPPAVVSKSEHAQIKSRLPQFVKELELLGIDFKPYRHVMKRPLRPLWITRDSILPEQVPQFTEFYPVLLCTASKRVKGTELSEGGYIQGAGDDSEGWSHGLTAPIFWNHKEELLKTSEHDLPEIIEKLIQSNKGASTSDGFTQLPRAPQIHIGKMSALLNQHFQEHDIVITIGPTVDSTTSHTLKNRYLHLSCRSGKLGSKDLRNQLSALPDFIARFSQSHTQSRQIFIACPDAKDLSISVALAILCLYCSDSGRLQLSELEFATKRDITKTFIRQRLSWITTAMPESSTSRASLQSVHHFLFAHEPSGRYIPASSPATVSAVSQANKVSRSNEMEETSSNAEFSTDFIFERLAGSWTFERECNNNNKSSPTHVTGAATFKAINSDSYNYIEQGTMLVKGEKHAITRNWIYKRTAQKTPQDIGLEILFDDGECKGKCYRRLSRDQRGIHGKYIHGENMYETTYLFDVLYEKLVRIVMITVVVEGQKSYTSRTEFVPSQ